jgi:nicotinamidase-related amidase
MTKSLSLNPEQTSLLVIDVQRALFTRPNPVYQAYKLLETINTLIDRCRLYGVEVIFIQHANQSILQEGTEGWQIHPDLSPKGADTMIHKKQGNAFIDTPLERELISMGVKNLLITGMVTQGCIRATSLGGLEKGYRVFLVEGGHSNYNKDAAQVIDKWEGELTVAGVQLVPAQNIDFS